MNDQELDILFTQSARHQKAVESINRQVMQTVRRDMRLKTIRKWVRLFAFCFGAPALLVLYIYMLFNFMPDMSQTLRVICMVLPVGTLFALFGKQFHDFSSVNM